MAARKQKAFTPEEQAAMRERARERRAAAKDPEGDIMAKIKAMPASDREMAERLAAAIKSGVPELAPRTWYGMPAWTKDDKVVCFFQTLQVQDPVCHVRLQRQGQAGRREHVAERVRPEEADQGRREADSRAGQASREKRRGGGPSAAAMPP